jgi:hypothetical protein
VPGVTGPREARAPTQAALARVFERMALLPGVVAEARADEGRAALRAFGEHLGSAIYLIDALDDLEEDHSSGGFNPCLVRGPKDGPMRVSWERIELAWELLHDDLAALRDLAGSMPFRRHREIVRSVVAGELFQLAEAAARRAYAHARGEQDRARSARRGATWARRAVAAAATAFMFLWVWLASLPALAQNKKRPPPARKPDVGVDAGTDAGKPPPPAWEPRLPAPPPAKSAAPPKDTKPGGNSETKKKDESPPAPPSPSGTASPGEGSGCGNPCSGCSCGSGKSNPCNACGGCCDSCKDCCKICDTCKGCDSCCKGCNNCNSCCK